MIRINSSHPDNVILEELKTLDDMIDISFAAPIRL